MERDEGLLREALWLSEAVVAGNVPLLVIEEECRIRLASAGACRMLGLPAGELLGQPLTRFLAPDLPLTPDGLPERCDQGRPQELTLFPAHGGAVPVEVVCDHFRDAEGRRRSLIAIHDITHMKMIDEDRVRRLGRLSLLNQINEALYGERMTLEQILEAVLHCVTAGQGLRFNRAFLLLIDDKSQRLRGEIAIGPSNSDEAARIWHDLSDQQDDLIALMTRYDRSLKQTDVAVNEIVKTMEVPVAAADHILIRSMNERQAFRVVASEVDFPGMEDMRRWLGHTAFAVAPLMTRRGPLGVIVADNAISGREIGDLDLEFLQLLANESANAIENSRLYQELQQRLADLRRAAQRQKEDQKQLLRMERLSIMGETAAVVAHELRNPLVAIGGFARTLHRSLAEGDPHKQYAAIITEEVARLERIIHDLLDFIRPKKILRKLVVVDELVAETVRVYEGKMGEQGVVLALDLQAPGVRARINPGEIQQVMQNLVINAMQAMAGGGRLAVLTRLQTGGVRVEVCDEGPGVPEAAKPKLFTPFFTTKPTGSGLGLAISSQIVKGHGGVLACQNALGGGAIFTFTLPLPKPRHDEGEEADSR